MNASDFVSYSYAKIFFFFFFFFLFFILLEKHETEQYGELVVGWL